MTPSLSFIREAQTACRAGDDARAATLYEQALRERPELASVCRPNLERLQAKLGGARPAHALPGWRLSGRPVS